MTKRDPFKTDWYKYEKKKSRSRASEGTKPRAYIMLMKLYDLELITR